MSHHLFDAIGDEMDHPDDTTGPLIVPDNLDDEDLAAEVLADVRTEMAKFISEKFLNGGEVKPDDHGVFNFLYGDTHIAIEAYEG